MRWHCLSAALMVALVSAIGTAQAAPATTTKSLGRAPSGAQLSTLILSSSLDRVAEIACTDSSCAVHINGVAGRSFDRIVPRTLRFAGGAVVAYAGKSGAQTAIVVEGTELAVPSDLAPPALSFNPAVSDDGKKVMAVLLGAGSKSVRVFDVGAGTHRDLGPYDDVVQPQYGPDGRGIFVAKRGAEMFVVIDGVEGKKHETVSPVTISPDGKRFAFRATDGGVSRFVVDDVPGEPLGMVSPFAFSPDSKRYGYSTSSPDSPTRYILDGQVTLGPSGGNVASAFVFSPDSQHVGYIVANDKDQVAYSIDGVVGPFEKSVAELTFWTSGTKVKQAYGRVNAAGKRAIVFTGGRTPAFAISGSGLSLTWSADGRSFAYMVGDGSETHARQFAMVDGKRATPAGFTAMGPAVFAKTGHQSAHLASSANRTLGLIVDSKKRLTVDGVRMSSVIATEAGFAFVVERQKERLRVEWRPR